MCTPQFIAFHFKPLLAERSHATDRSKDLAFKPRPIFFSYELPTANFYVQEAHSAQIYTAFVQRRNVKREMAKGNLALLSVIIDRLDHSLPICCVAAVWKPTSGAVSNAVGNLVAAAGPRHSNFLYGGSVATPNFQRASPRNAKPNSDWR